VKKQREKERTAKLANNKAVLVSKDSLMNSKEIVSETSSEDENDESKYKD
jgi:hypothetical protein